MSKRFTPPKRMNPALYMMSEEQRNSTLIHATNQTNLLLTLMILRDEFDFEHEEAKRFMDKYRDILDSYAKGYLNSHDIRTTLEEELKLEIRL